MVLVKFSSSFRPILGIIVVGGLLGLMGMTVHVSEKWRALFPSGSDGRSIMESSSRYFLSSGYVYHKNVQNMEFVEALKIDPEGGVAIGSKRFVFGVRGGRKDDVHVEFNGATSTMTVRWEKLGGSRSEITDFEERVIHGLERVLKNTYDVKVEFMRMD